MYLPISQNPYQSSSVLPSATERRSLLAAFRVGPIIGSIVPVLLGTAVVGRGMLPSDARGFFLLSGAHLNAGGGLGAISLWTKGRGGLRRLLCWMSMIVNAALAVRIAIMMPAGTLRL